MKLPNPEFAVIDIAKLRDYRLDPKHPRGRHKARVFESSLGITQDEADQLQNLIQSGISTAKATPGTSDDYGDRFTSDFKISYQGHSAFIRTAWIILRHENFPRLTTCYIL